MKRLSGGFTVEAAVVTSAVLLVVAAGLLFAYRFSALVSREYEEQRDAVRDENIEDFMRRSSVVMDWDDDWDDGEDE